jgi:hypothetical protein
MYLVPVHRVQREHTGMPGGPEVEHDSERYRGRPVIDVSVSISDSSVRFLLIRRVLDATRRIS